ncbi:MAG: KH domain-containing protein [Armatimonadetes bacterium]|nr:KH domain-containing protein [Armatimonadota bacterium]
MKELVEYMVRALVDDPASVRVNVVESGNLTVYEVSVAEGDLGKIIGRHGRIANALRGVVKAAAMRTNDRATVEIVS